MEQGFSKKIKAEENFKNPTQPLIQNTDIITFSEQLHYIFKH